MAFANLHTPVAPVVDPRYDTDMTGKNTLIFDLDGTLIDSAPDIRAAVNAALESQGRGALDLPTVTSFIGNGVEVLVRLSLIETGGWDPDVQRTTLAAMRAYYTRHPAPLTRIYPGVEACLDDLKRSGARLGICTNKPHAAALDICSRLGLSRHFAVIRGAQEGQAKKPDPSPLLACIKDLNGTVETTLYIGDSAVDYHTALNAGVAFRLYSGGYLNDPLPDLAAENRFAQWQANGLLSWREIT